MPHLGAPQKEQATQLSHTVRGPSLVPYRLPSCQSRVCELPGAQVLCLCGFPHHDLNPPGSYNHSSLSSIGLLELGPVLSYRSLHPEKHLKIYTKKFFKPKFKRRKKYFCQFYLLGDDEMVWKRESTAALAMDQVWLAAPTPVISLYLYLRLQGLLVLYGPL